VQKATHPHLEQSGEHTGLEVSIKTHLLQLVNLRLRPLFVVILPNV
jgi:hypothetical protein